MVFASTELSQVLAKSNADVEAKVHKMRGVRGQAPDLYKILSN